MAKASTWRDGYAIGVSAFVACTGFFHGYDNGVVNDVFTMPSFRHMMGWPEEENSMVAFWAARFTSEAHIPCELPSLYSLSMLVPSQEGLTVNGFNLSAAVAAVLAGHLLVDRHGRRPALLMGTLLFAAGGAVQASALNTWMLILGRVVAGVGVGITSSAGPPFIAEVAPPKRLVVRRRRL